MCRHFPLKNQPISTLFKCKNWVGKGLVLPTEEDVYNLAFRGLEIGLCQEIQDTKKRVAILYHSLRF